MTVINDTRVVRLQRVAARTGHQHSADERIVEEVTSELVTSADVVSLPPGSLVTLQRGPGAGHTEEGSVLNAARNDIGGVAGGQTTSVSFSSEDAGVTAATIFVTEVDYTTSLSAAGQYAINYKTFQIKTYTAVPTTPGSRILVTYAWAPIREYLQWSPEDLEPDLIAFGVGPHLSGTGGGADVDAGCNILVETREDGYKEISLDIQSIAGVGLVVDAGIGCPQLRVDIDAYQVGYDDSSNVLIFASNVQDAIQQLDAYLSVGEVIQLRKYGSDADNYPFNSVYSTDGNLFPVAGHRLMVWINGLPLFDPADYHETSSTTIELTDPINDSDIVDIWIIPKFLGVGPQDTADLQLAYNNSLVKEIEENNGQITFRQTQATGSALRLISNSSLTPTLAIDQSGSGEGARIKSVDATKSSLLVQKDTTSRNSIIDSLIIERSTSHILGGQTGIGTSLLTRLESSGSSLFSASRIVTGTESAADAAEKTYLSIELSNDGVLTEHLRLTSTGRLAVGTTAPNAMLHVAGDGYFDGYLMPVTDNQWGLGTPDKRWRSISIGPGSLEIIGTAAEVGVDRNWFLGISVGGDLQFSQGSDRLVRIKSDGTLITDKLNISNPMVPISASSTGIAGDIAWDSGFIYVCVATDTWVRASVNTWV